MTLTLPIPPAPSTDDDWIDDIKTAARMVGVPAEFPPPEPPLDHPVADLSNTACPDCGWFVHYLGNPQHANCKSM